MSDHFEREIDRLKSDISSVKSRMDSVSGQCDMLSEQIESGKNRLDEIFNKQLIYVKAIEVLDMAQQVTRVTIKDGFESIVTYALQFILGNAYRFELDFGRWGKYHEVNMNVLTEEFTEPYDPMDTSGGGVVDIVSLALRVAIMELHKPDIQGPIILDESFKHLSRQHLFRAGAFLNALAERVGRQIIMVSHKSELVKMAHKAIEVK
jgi:DNA repair exonuclease SbcCD ATPase subunit